MDSKLEESLGAITSPLDDIQKCRNLLMALVGMQIADLLELLNYL